MALEINIIRAASDSTKAPRMPLNLVETDFNGWSLNSSGSGANPSITGGTNGDTIVCTKSGVGQSWAGISFPVEAGKSYAVGCFIGPGSGTLDVAVSTIYTDATASEGEPELIARTRNRWFCTRFTSSVTENVLLRLGIGAGGDDDQTVTSQTIQKPFVYEIDSVTSNCPEYVAGWGNQNGSEERAAIFSYANGNKVRDGVSRTPLGQIDLNYAPDAENVPLGAINPYTFGVFVADSFGNADTEWPALLVEKSGHMLLIGNASPGETMDQFDTRLNDVLNLYSFDYTGNIPPSFAILQGSVNSPNTPQTADQMVATVTSMIDKCKALDILPVVTNIPPLGGATSFTNAKGIELAAYNQRLPGICAANGAVFVDIFTPLVADDGYSTKLGYVNPAVDELHPNEAGSQVIADAIHKALTATAAGGAGVTGIISNSIITR